MFELTREDAHLLLKLMQFKPEFVRVRPRGSAVNQFELQPDCSGGSAARIC